MVEEYIDKIESISRKFNNVISPSDIISWLSNFDSSDWDMALTVLNQIEYFSLNDIIREYDLVFDSLVVSLENQIKEENISRITAFLKTSRLFNTLNLRKRVILHPIGEFAKSGPTMFYFLKQAPSFKKALQYIKVENSIDKIEKHLKKDSIVILIDDILGSGKTLTDYYDEHIRVILSKPKYVEVKVHALCLIYLQQAEDHINKKHKFKIYGNLRNPAFSKNGSVFGYRPKMVQIREFCYKYGKGLYKSFDWKTKTTNEHPLGHNNSQALIVFSHSVPNNTLPIIWSSKISWKPIFERFGIDKISKSKKLRFDTRRWISMLKNLGFSNILLDNTNIYSKINIHQLMILRLKKSGKQNSFICQYLNIGESDLKEIIKSGIEKGIFKKDFTISEYGEKIYSELRKMDNILKTKTIDRDLNEYNTENIYYIPKLFRGMK